VEEGKDEKRGKGGKENEGRKRGIRGIKRRGEKKRRKEG
jgi:hypothetical protein